MPAPGVSGVTGVVGRGDGVLFNGEFEFVFGVELLAELLDELLPALALFEFVAPVVSAELFVVEALFVLDALFVELPLSVFVDVPELLDVSSVFFSSVFSGSVVLELLLDVELFEEPGVKVVLAAVVATVSACRVSVASVSSEIGCVLTADGEGG